MQLRPFCLVNMHELSQSIKQNIRNRVACTLQLPLYQTSKLNYGRTARAETIENERQHSHTARRKERSDCVMDKKDYHDKMDTCQQQTDLTHTVQRKLLKLKQSTFDATTGCGVEFNSHLNCMNYRSYTNPAYLCGLFTVLFCGFPTYQLSKYTTNVLMKPLTYELGH